MRIRDVFHLNYESQIRISLVFFILFLILINFGTEYLFHQTKRALERQIHQQLSTVAQSASLVWEKSPQSALKKSLMELSFNSDASRISFLSSDGEPLISSAEISSRENLHLFWGVKPELVKSLKAEDDRERPDKFLSDFYTDGSGNTFLSYYLALEKPTYPEVENAIWVMVEKEVSAFSNIEKLSRINAWTRIVGLLIAAFVTLLLIRNLLRPYQLMVKKAKKEEIITTLEKTKKEGEMDVAVRIFEQVIMELKQKEKTLQQLYQKTDRKAKDLASYNEYILKSITSGMIICDEDGKITRMNHQAETMLDLTDGRAIGKHYKSIFSEESPLCSAIHTSITEQITYTVTEINLKRKRGERISVSVSSSPVKDEQGRMLGVVVFLTDLTEIKRLEEQIAFKDKMATLGEMSSGLAHELRNSMGAILGFTKLLKKRKEDHASISQIVERITNEALSMESMLQRFLAFARPFEPKMEEIDIKTIVEECLTSVAENLKENRISLQFNSELNLPSIQGDRLLLKQCFQNLIQNSIEAMPNGGKLYISLRQEQLTSQGKSVLVEFSDTGCGMAKKVQDKIFNPFFTTKEKGTGLGLSLVKKIIDLHNGKIELESELNKGTTFRICLPLKSTLGLSEVYSKEKNKLPSVINSSSKGVDDGLEVESFAGKK